MGVTEGEFKTVGGRETFRNHCVHIWRCPSCRCWYEVTENACRIDNTPRVEPGPESIHEAAD